MKKKLNQSVKFTFLTVTYMFHFPIMAVVFCFTSVCLSWPQFCSTAEQRGSTFPVLSDLPNLSPNARWGTHTAEIITSGHYNILCQDPVVPGNAHVFLSIWVFKVLIQSILAASWHFYPTKHHVFVLATEGILFSPNIYVILNFF